MNGPRQAGQQQTLYEKTKFLSNNYTSCSRMG